MSALLNVVPHMIPVEENVHGCQDSDGFRCPRAPSRRPNGINDVSGVVVRESQEQRVRRAEVIQSLYDLSNGLGDVELPKHREDPATVGDAEDTAGLAPL